MCRHSVTLVVWILIEASHIMESILCQPKIAAENFFAKNNSLQDTNMSDNFSLDTATDTGRTIERRGDMPHEYYSLDE